MPLLSAQADAVIAAAQAHAVAVGVPVVIAVVDAGVHLKAFVRMDGAQLREGFDAFFATPEGSMDPKKMVDRMIEIVPADTGLFRNVVPKAIEGMLKEHQQDAWSNTI